MLNVTLNKALVSKGGKFIFMNGRLVLNFHLPKVKEGDTGMYCMLSPGSIGDEESYNNFGIKKIPNSKWLCPDFQSNMVCGPTGSSRLKLGNFNVFS